MDVATKFSIPFFFSVSSFPDKHVQHVSHGLVEHSIYRRTHLSRMFRDNSRLEALTSIRSLDKYMMAVAVFESIRTFLHRIIYQSLVWEPAVNVIFGRSCDLMVTCWWPSRQAWKSRLQTMQRRLSVVLVPKCSFYFLSTRRCHSWWNDGGVSSASLPPPPAVPPPFSAPFSPHLPFLLSLSHLSVSPLWGQEMSSFPALIGWCMKLLGGMKACITQRIWNRREGERMRRRRRDGEMFWRAPLKGRRWGETLQMLARNNGSRSQSHWFLNPGTLPLGNCPTDLIPVSSVDLGAPRANPKKACRLRSALGPSLGSAREGTGEV